MTVRRHRNQITVLAHCAGRDFLGRIPAGENRLGLVSVLYQCISDGFDVLAVFLHFFRLTQVELIDVAGRPAVGDVDQYD